MKSPFRIVAVALVVVAGLSACTKPASDAKAVAAAPKPIPVKVVVVSMFEIGKDSGDTAGEFQHWKEGQKLDERFPFAHHHDLYLNPQTGVLGMVTGMGTANSASAVMELGMDPRFDLSHAYWLVAGIAGFDPEDASIGSAAWAEWLVDGDLAHEIDPREMPKDWSTGYFPLGTKEPYGLPKPEPMGEVFHLNAGLTDWAYQLTRNVDLGDSPVLQQRRARYKGFPNAQKPPFVLKGDNLAAMTYWHGKLMNEWANRWVKYWTDGKGEFVSSAMEDTGTAQSLTYLTPTGKVDFNRLMVLRTASNYSMQPPGMTAAESLLEDHAGAPGEGYSALDMATGAAYKVGSKVVDEIVQHWDQYRDHVPSS
ncbi:purine nucleoside permease [Solimonas marina]|uniref:Purine nucleoside permease n=1 Tax=Solimonas marina TaxID=2714601 RepID=A0A969WDY4_9GAMM|nr:purine nucleoside permease [Solimonas marina]NKF24228.1 purine nucleoside permease [Solimonas marina]